MSQSRHTLGPTCKQTPEPVLLYASTNEAERGGGEKKKSLTGCCPSLFVCREKSWEKQHKWVWGNYAEQNNERGWRRKRRRCGDIRLKAQRWGLLAGCSIRFASCPLRYSPLSSSSLSPGLNWPPQLHLTPLPACSAHVYASQIPPGHGQTGRPGVAPVHLTKAIWCETPFGSSSPACSPSIVLIRPR